MEEWREEGREAQPTAEKSRGGMTEGYVCVQYLCGRQRATCSPVGHPHTHSTDEHIQQCTKLLPT